MAVTDLQRIASTQQIGQQLVPAIKELSILIYITSIASLS